MADKKISELTTITGANTASGDLFVIVDVDANETKKITRDELTNALELTDFDNIDINGGTIDGTPIGGSTPAAGTFTTLTANGNVVLGDAATDTVTVTADVASDLIPSVDGSFDLGASGAEWQDLFIDGTANIDSLVADTADINGGTIDGTTIGATTPSTGDFTTLTENDSPAVVQSDIGTDPDEIPLNQYLGKLAYQDIPYLDEDERPIVPLTTPSVQDVIDALLALQLIKQED